LRRRHSRNTHVLRGCLRDIPLVSVHSDGERFKLAYKAGKIQKCRHFPHLKESAPRTGFVEESEYNKLAKNAPELWLRALLATAYTFGFRQGELIPTKHGRKRGPGLRAKQVDLMKRTIRLNAGETKSDEGRLVKLTNDVYTLLQACIFGRKADDYVFTRKNGQPILDFPERWEKLTVAAECPGLLFHDLRRSGVRNMIRRGIPEVVAMKISGHKTRDVFDRYNIVSEADLADAALKIEAGKQLWAENGQKCAEMHQKQAMQNQSEVAGTTAN